MAVTSRVVVANVKPFGINLGNWTFWGAEQLSANVIKNPGFEGLIDGAIAIPLESGRNTFDDSPNWLARSDGFWEGARYSIRAGTDAGAEGVIVHSLKSGRGRRPTFSVREGDPVPEFGSAVALIRDSEDSLPSQWWFSRGSGSAFAADRKQVRPGSAGHRSLRITAAGSDYAEVASYFDTISERAGKMLPLTGEWKLSFWVKADVGDATLRVILARDGSRPVLKHDLQLSGSWMNVEVPFQAADDGPPGTVSLRFQVTGHPFAQVLLDDVDLRRTRDAGKPFREEVVTALRSFHPGYLRDWQGQLGDTFENRTATAFARKAYRYRPGDGDAQSDFGYGIGDFLDLAADIGATPWITIPPTFSDEDCARLGGYLSGRGFSPRDEVMTEFGNESWNDLFRAGGIPDPVMYGQAADRCFVAMRSKAHGFRLKTVVGVQFANPQGAVAYARESRHADIVAMAPYYAYTLAPGIPVRDRMALLFEPLTGMDTIHAAVSAMKMDTAVYEVNLHTTLGNASADERRPVVGGIASGSALARNMLDALALGSLRQCVYELSGFDWAMPSGRDFVPMWGVMRDLGSTQRARPTGLALRLLNGALHGNMLEVRQDKGSEVSLYAFRSGKSLSVVAVSASPVRREILVQLPPDATYAANWDVSRLSAPSPTATNEDSEQVRIIQSHEPGSGNALKIALEPWSMGVWTSAGPGELKSPATGAARQNP